MTLNTAPHIEGVFTLEPLSVEEEISEIHAKLDEQIKLLNLIVGEIKPVIDAMAASPIGRMFGMENPA